MRGNLHAYARVQLAQCKAFAMRGRKAEAIVRLQEAAATSVDLGRRLDALHLHNLQAEVCFMDCQSEDALAVFTTSIDPFLAAVPITDRAVLEHNRVLVSVNLWEQRSIQDFYRAVDLRRRVAPETFDTADALRAEEAALQAKHWEALPLFWRDLFKAYSIGDWNLQWQAHSRMARECLRLGWLPQAYHHGVMARDKDAMETVAQAANEYGRPDIVGELISSVLSQAHLLGHAATSATLVRELWDVIPDEMLPPIMAWATKLAGIAPQNRDAASAVGEIWRMLIPLLHRASGETAGQVLRIALLHPLFQEITHERKLIIRCIANCVGKVSEDDHLVIARSTAELIKGKNSDLDLDVSISLAAKLAECSPAAREYLGNEILPRGTQISDPRLIEIAGVFQRITDASGANRLALGIAGDVRRQVCRLSGVATSDEQAIGGFGTIVKTNPDGSRTIVSVMSSGLELDAIVAHRQALAQATVSEIAGAVIGAISDPDNIAANLTMLINFLMEIADVLSEDDRTLVASKLRPLASGSLPASIVDAQAFATNPLNPFQMQTGSPQEVQGIALLAIATLVSGRTHSVVSDEGDTLVSLIDVGLEHKSSDVRRFAVAAALRLATIPERTLAALLSKIWDQDPAVSAVAIAVCRNADFQPNISQWWTCAHGIRAALQQPNPHLRQSAAGSIRSLQFKALTDDQRVFCSELERVALGDARFSVRQQIR